MVANTRDRYLVTPSATVESLAEDLPAHLLLIEEPRYRVKSTFLDTFDWRLYARGWQLQWISQKGHNKLVLSSLNGEDFCACDLGKDLPGLIAELHDEDLRSRLQDAMEMRALIPRARLEKSIRAFRVLNNDQKTVVRLYLEQAVVRPASGSDKTPLPVVIRLRPIKGYDSKLDATEKVIRENVDIVVPETDYYTTVLTAAGESPGDYSSKLNIRLTAEMQADAATRVLLRSLLATMRENLQGTKEDIDSEFLHDFRVAIRRTRSALSQIKNVFEPQDVDKYKQAFAWLGGITGATRDLDVFLLSYEDYRDSLPARLQPDLDAFQQFLVSHQAIEQQALRRRLSNRKFYKLLEDWEAFLDQDVTAEAVNAGRPVTAVARERIWRMYRKVRKEGRAITSTSPDEDLHELRKSCKKLRYLIEFFSSLFPAKDIKPLIKALKQLLDNLGEFNDISVQVDHIEDYARQMSEEGAAPSRALIAMGVLVGDLLHRHEVVRQEFKSQFAAFDTKKNDANYRRLFKEEPA